MPKDKGNRWSVYQTPEESKLYLDMWAERLRLPEQKEETMADMIKATVVHANQSMAEKIYEADQAMLNKQEEWNPFLDEYNAEKVNYEIDKETGEVLPATIDTDEITIYAGEKEPEYLKQLRLLDITDENKLALLSLYESQVNARPFKAYINKEVEIYGGIIWYHPDFKAKNSLPDDPLTPGYHKILFLIMENGEPAIMEASYGALAVHVSNMLAINGWFIWKEPVKYMIAQHPSTNAFQMYNASRVKSMLFEIKKTVKK